MAASREEQLFTLIKGMTLDEFTNAVEIEDAGAHPDYMNADVDVTDDQGNYAVESIKIRLVEIP